MMDKFGPPRPKLLIPQNTTLEPLYKHSVGNRICMLIMEVCLYRGTVLAHLKKSGPESQCL